MITVADERPRSSQPAPVVGLSHAERKLIEPDEADRVRFRDLLQNADFGLVKLRNVTCGRDGPMIVRAGECGDSIPGHGADYSFRAGRHAFPGIADVKLDGDLLVAGSVMTQGLLVSIGRVDIRTLDLSSAAIKFLKEFVPAADAAGAQRQTLLINKGILANGFAYCATAHVAEGESYALRTIAYRTRNDGSDRRTDLIIAFTVVRRDADGNVTLIWRRLQERPSPKIEVRNDNG